MNRFKKGGRFLRAVRKLHLAYLAFLAVLVLAAVGLSRMSDTTAISRRESLENALRRDVMHCYAIEGTYPPSLSYMEEHYGLTYDHDLFFVDYQTHGSNLMPDITIVELKDIHGL